MMKIREFIDGEADSSELRALFYGHIPVLVAHSYRYVRIKLAS